MRHSLFACLLAIVLVGTSCSSKKDDQPPVATPSVAFSHPKAALGSPLDVTYRFQVAADAPAFDENYRVMVHFLDGDEEIMWTDDHEPPVATKSWKPGQVVEYKRTLFVPIYPYIGDAAVQVGLYSPKDNRRLPLAGENTGQRAYKVATLQLLPQTENIFLIYKEGWHQAEVAADNATVEWQWTKKAATLSFRNPRRDATFYLHADNPGTVFQESQTVQVMLNGQPIGSVTFAPRQERVERMPLTAAQLGTADMAEIRLEVDKTYVPALLPAANSRDPRELGVRVFHAFVEPR